MSADETEDRPETAPQDGNRTARAPADEDDQALDEHDQALGEHDRFLDEELIPILVVGGLVLFLFPEPVTSSIGIVLVGVGLGLWLWDLLS